MALGALAACAPAATPPAASPAPAPAAAASAGAAQPVASTQPVAGVAPASAPAAAGVVTKGSVTVVQGPEIKTLDGTMEVALTYRNVILHMYDTLFYRNEKMQPTPLYGAIADAFRGMPKRS